MVDTARQLYDDVRRRVLRSILRTDANIDRIYKRLAQRLRRRFRLTGMTDAEVRRALEEEFRAVEEELLPQLEADLHQAAEGGNEAARRTLKQLGALGGEGAHPFPSAPRSRAHLQLVSSQPSGSGARSRGTD